MALGAVMIRAFDAASACMMPPPLAAAVAMAGLVPATGTAATDTTSTGTAAAAPVAPTDQLYQVPLALTVTGSYTELSDFVDRLENLRRVMLVTGFTLGSATTSTAGGGATAGLTMTLNGRVFMVHSVPAVVVPVVASSATTTGTTGTTGTATTGTPATAGAAN